jgi:hypothetical protein
MNQMIQDFDMIIQQYGHDILLQKRVQDQDLDCVQFESKMERHTVRHMLPATRGLPTFMQEKMEGIVSTSERLYFFRKGAYPYSGDRIYEYDDAETRVGQSTWIIDEAVPMRGTGGHVVYWIVGATQERPN